ncbi:MAG TPA: lipopolysaccharide biosynthesis protein, partial [Hanamia sp.]|nr:lipopolysaccharide biosynthesis protein [Hanamia sp.]
MSLRKTAISGMIWAFAQQFGTQAIGFFVSIIMARLLLPKEFGLIGMISVFIGIGNSLITSGLTQSLIRTSNANQEDYSTIFYFNLLGSIIIYLVLFFFAPLIAAFFSQPVLINIIRLYCLSFIITAFSEVQLTKLTKEMNFKLQMTITIPSLICSALLGIFLAFKGYGVWSLVWMSLFQSFLSTVQLWFQTGWSPSLVFNIEKFRYHFKFGYKITLSGLLNTIFNNIYQIIIGKFFVAADVGFYTRANSLKQLPVTNISSALNKVTYPLFASIQNDDLRL